MPDGTIHKTPRDRAKLKANSDPTIFPNHPDYYKPNETKRKSPKKRAVPKRVPNKTNTNENVEEPLPPLILEPVAADAEKYTAEENPTEIPATVPTSSVWPYLEIKKLPLPSGWIVCDTPEGTGKDRHKSSVACRGAVGVHARRCEECRTEKKRLQKDEDRKEKLEARQKEKVNKYRNQIHQALIECSYQEKDILEKAISKLPEAQQEAVRACFEAATRKGPSGWRYTPEWVYKCLLMRIKDRKLYEHIREHKILILPCMLLIDEMHLLKGLYFDASVLKVQGFKDMGEDTHDAFEEDFSEEVNEAMEKLPIDPRVAQKAKRRETTQEKNKNKRDRNLGDHALVISFQPFMGTWVQPIGCFLTHGCANDDELTKLVLEEVILTERSGYFVDGVVTDGASWNRSMWKKFGVSQDNPRAVHPCDEDRHL
ncbi:hypothetical protein FOCC_FOCC015933 [Frankliniella occidentalis]|nr:hypothetical protein FOCC_FOCC015933 [Frankliniella occidentalis]